MKVSEHLLRMICIKPSSCFDTISGQHNESDKKLEKYRHYFSSFFDEALTGKVILDYGCGGGFQLLACVDAGVKLVHGIDVRDVLHPDVCSTMKQPRYKGRLQTFIGFSHALLKPESYDVILCYDSFEHFSDPGSVLKEFNRLLKPMGIVFMHFGPLWLSPRGGHMQFMCRLPWWHLFFSEKTIMKVRAHYRKDNAKRFEEVEGGLNRMTVKKFKGFFRYSPLQINFFRVIPVRGMHFLANLPAVGEFFSSAIACILRKEQLNGIQTLK